MEDKIYNESRVVVGYREIYDYEGNSRLKDKVRYDSRRKYNASDIRLYMRAVDDWMDDWRGYAEDYN